MCGEKHQGRLAIIETSSTLAYEKTSHFNLNHGYEVICRVLGFYAPEDDKLILRKRLRRNQRIGSALSNRILGINARHLFAEL